MRLIIKEKVTYYEYVCEGCVTSLEEQAPLANMLKTIKKDGIKSFKEDELMKNFAKGLISSFESDGYLTPYGQITAEGEDVIKTQKAWKKLKGVFKLGCIRKDSRAYIVKCEPYFEEKLNNNRTEPDMLSLFDGEYQNGVGSYKDVKLKPTCVLLKRQEIDIRCEYDYKKDKNFYVVEVDDKKIKFPENEKTFRLVNDSIAKDLLQNALANYEKFSINGEIVTLEEATGNQLLNNAIQEIFHKGSFDATPPDGAYEIKDIRVLVKTQKTAKELLLQFLLNRAQSKYCGYGEVATLISEFYGLFESCPDVNTNTRMVYSELIKKASDTNSTAYLRLRAYEDLMPDTIQKKHEIKTLLDCSNSKMSIAELVEKIVGDGVVKSVTIFTKFAYKNPAISRAIYLFGNALKRRNNIPLKLITTRDETYLQNETAKEYYNMLKKNPNVDLVEKPFQKIHDRYYRIEKESGEVEWIKMTGELDALRYPNDFVDGKTPDRGIDENTTASVKEMTIVSVDRQGIISEVITAMEG